MLIIQIICVAVVFICFVVVASIFALSQNFSNKAILLIGSDFEEAHAYVEGKEGANLYLTRLDDHTFALSYYKMEMDNFEYNEEKKVYTYKYKSGKKEQAVSFRKLSLKETSNRYDFIDSDVNKYDSMEIGETISLIQK